MKKGNKGITLISLIVTIIIMLILAGVAINFAIGENGIFKLAENAGEKYENVSKKEEIDIAKLNNQIEGYISGGRQANLVPDYSSKVDILSYNSEDNQYTTPTDGYILIPSAGLVNVKYINIYFDEFEVVCLSNSNSEWIRQHIFLPISKNTKVYYKIEGAGRYSLDMGCWFIPAK